MSLYVCACKRARESEFVRACACVNVRFFIPHGEHFRLERVSLPSQLTH